MSKVKHIHCPANAWDCPYYSDTPQKCICLMPYEDLDPMKECDDFAAFWSEDDDYWDDDYEYKGEE